MAQGCLHPGRAMAQGTAEPQASVLGPPWDQEPPGRAEPRTLGLPWGHRSCPEACGAQQCGPPGAERRHPWHPAGGTWLPLAQGQAVPYSPWHWDGDSPHRACQLPAALGMALCRAVSAPPRGARGARLRQGRWAVPPAPGAMTAGVGGGGAGRADLGGRGLHTPHTVC